MHELSVAQSLIKIVETELLKAGGGVAKTVFLEIGSLSTLEPESLEFCFDIVCAGTSIAGCKLVIETICAEASCNACGKVFSLAAYATPCPACAEYALTILSGKDMKVTRLEIESPDTK